MTNVRSITLARPPFCEGDEVELAKGLYVGTPGVFLRVKEDASWVDITERNGAVRSHPRAWLSAVSN
jgi:hypothetical protein